MSNNHTQAERLIAACLIIHILDQGYTISVQDGDMGYSLRRSTNADEIWSHLFSMDEDYLYIRKDNTRIGWIRLTYSNGPDVISDYSYNDTMSALIDPLFKLSDALYETDVSTLLLEVYPTPKELAWAWVNIIKAT